MAADKHFSPFPPSMRRGPMAPVFPFLTVAFVLLGVLPSGQGLGSSSSNSPNILLLFADDLGRYASAYRDSKCPSANDVIDTPSFDRIANEGVLFSNAFVSAPSCTPSRASLYTGRHFFRNGSHSQLHFPWGSGMPDPFKPVVGFPNQLAEAGYHVGWSHKWHMRTSLIGGKQNHYATTGNQISNYSQRVSGAQDQSKAKSMVLQSVRDNFRAFLTKRVEGQPFFYSFNPTNTHRPWVRGSGKELWGIEPSKLKGRMPSFLPDNSIVREDFADYLGEAMAFDAACGTILKELESTGELDNTLVCITGDHGIPGFPRGKCNVYDFGARVLLAIRWPERIAANHRVDTPVSLIDLGPTFLSASGVESSEDVNGEDLLPALVEGGSTRSLRGWALIGREAHVGPCRPGGVPYPVRAIRTSEFLYTVNFKPERWPVATPPLAAPFAPAMKGHGKHARRRMDFDAGPTLTWFMKHEADSLAHPYWQSAIGRRPAEELYHLATDPDQMRNLAEDSKWQQQRKQLRKQLFRELEANHDPRLQDAFDKPPYNTTAWEK